MDGADGFASYQMSGTHYGYTYDSWKNANNIETATKAFMAVFERPNMELAHTERRCNSAQKAYDKYKGKSISGGEYKEVNKDGIIGRFKSNITGKTFTIFAQNDVGLIGNCNRAASASIATGYRESSKSEMDVIEDVKLQNDGLLSNSTVNQNFFKNYGLRVAINDSAYSIENIRRILSEGKYVTIWFKGTAIGKSGSTYSGGNMHWIAVIGYKNENNNEQIFISDSGWKSTGWKGIDEFENCKQSINYFDTVF